MFVFIIFIIIIFIIYLLWLLLISFIYNRHLKRDSEIMDFRKKASFYTLFSNTIGLVFLVFTGGWHVLMTYSPESYFFPVVGFLISVLLNFCLLYYFLFEGKKYLTDIIKIVVFCSPYYLLLPIILNLLVFLGLLKGIY